MTKIETIEVENAKAQNALAYTEALFVGLNREPEAFEYTGEIIDCGNEGECVCGHPIRWGFPLQHKTDKATVKIVGSTCVNYFACVNEALYVSLMHGVERLNKQLADAKSASKRAQAQAEVDALAAKFGELYDTLKARYQSYRERREMAPRALWEMFGSYRYGVPSHPPEYTRPADYKRWYKQQIKRLEAAE